MGAGSLPDPGSAALLLDDYGDDSYGASGSVDVTGEVSGSDSDPSKSAVEAGTPTALVQADALSGFAALLDSLGTDRYSAIDKTHMTASDGAKACQYPAYTEAQAVGQGVDLLVDTGDLNAPDQFVAVPEMPARAGHRGDPVWENGAGVGVNAG